MGAYNRKTPAGYLAWVLVMNSHWLTPHGCSLQIYAGYLVWMLTSNFLWLPRMYAHYWLTLHGYSLKSILATPHGCLHQNFFWLPHMGAPFNFTLATPHGNLLHFILANPTWVPLQTCTGYQPWAYSTNTGLPPPWVLA